jgi:uncharacterized protein YggU (UPF0235/DUF167 family)
MHIKIRVIADAPREVIEQPEADHFVIYVREPALRNQANKRILNIIRETYPGKQVKLIKGHHSPSKIISIE